MINHLLTKVDNPETDLISRIKELEEIFYSARLLSIPPKVIEEIEKYKNKYNIVADFLNEQKYANGCFKEWVYINNLTDIINLKEELKNFYIKQRDTTIKATILTILVLFLEKEDEKFYLDISLDIFQISETMDATHIMYCIGYALELIKYKKREYDDYRIILNEYDEYQQGNIIFNSDLLFGTFNKNLYALKLISLLQDKTLVYKEFFYDKNEMGDYLDNQHNFYKNGFVITYSINNNFQLNLNINIGNIQYIELKNLDIGKIVKAVSILRNRLYEELENFVSNSKYVNSFLINTNKQFEFECIFFNDYETYGISINSKNKINKPIDSVEFIGSMSRIFLHLTMYLKIKNNICLYELSGLSKQDFLKIIGLKF